MSHSYHTSLFHCIFSTKGRNKIISPTLQERLHPYLAGVAKENGMIPLAVGDVEDHVHLLLSLTSTTSVAEAMQLIKSGSSKWVHDTFPELRTFSWQEGFGAFSIGISQVERTVRYISRQVEHHQVKTFQEEFLEFLQRHGVEYDERYVWG